MGSSPRGHGGRPLSKRVGGEGGVAPPSPAGGDFVCPPPHPRTSRPEGTGPGAPGSGEHREQTGGRRRGPKGPRGRELGTILHPPSTPPLYFILIFPARSRRFAQLRLPSPARSAFPRPMLYFIFIFPLFIPFIYLNFFFFFSRETKKMQKTISSRKKIKRNKERKQKGENQKPHTVAVAVAARPGGAGGCQAGGGRNGAGGVRGGPLFFPSGLGTTSAARAAARDVDVVKALRVVSHFPLPIPAPNFLPGTLSESLGAFKERRSGGGAPGAGGK